MYDSRIISSEAKGMPRVYYWAKFVPEQESETGMNEIRYEVEYYTSDSSGENVYPSGKKQIVGSIRNLADVLSEARQNGFQRQVNAVSSHQLRVNEELQEVCCSVHRARGLNVDELLLLRALMGIPPLRIVKHKDPLMPLNKVF